MTLNHNCKLTQPTGAGETSTALSRELADFLIELSIGVARQQLIIEGVATDDSNPVLRDLAAPPASGAGPTDTGAAPK
ncbi:MAG: hypothetical protein NTX19_00670 [Gemmatimonadetes bacterium]|nr:hypothetical protein [Gemmatimonadota bacterium]